MAVEREPQQGTSPRSAQVYWREVDRRRVRRTPNIVPFLVTGGLIGVIVGVILAAVGRNSPTSDYSHATVMAFFGFIFGALGVLVGAIVMLIVEKFTTR